MTSSRIILKDLSFSYRILRNRSSSFKEFLKESITRQIRIVEYTAIENLTLEVKSGEVIGLIGRNGAGKSTLLKIIAGVITPSSGNCSVIGKIAPLIELTAGFNQELTGKENVIFYSALMGRNLRIVRDRIVSIANWAGIGEHINYPLRTYSSGMVARLAFSTATDEKADILLIDEVFSVGDGAFREKSRLRMEDLINSGSAVVLVSHDMETIRKFATKVVWLEKGKVKRIGIPYDIIALYELELLEKD